MMILFGIGLLILKVIVDMIAKIPIIGGHEIIQLIAKLGILFPVSFAIVSYGLTRNLIVGVLIFVITTIIFMVAGGSLI